MTVSKHCVPNRCMFMLHRTISLTHYISANEAFFKCKYSKYCIFSQPISVLYLLKNLNKRLLADTNKCLCHLQVSKIPLPTVSSYFMDSTEFHTNEKNLCMYFYSATYFFRLWNI